MSEPSGVVIRENRQTILARICSARDGWACTAAVSICTYRHVHVLVADLATVDVFKSPHNLSQGSLTRVGFLRLADDTICMPHFGFVSKMVQRATFGEGFGKVGCRERGKKGRREGEAVPTGVEGRYGRPRGQSKRIKGCRTVCMSLIMQRISVVR